MKVLLFQWPFRRAIYPDSVLGGEVFLAETWTPMPIKNTMKPQAMIDLADSLFWLRCMFCLPIFAGKLN